MKTSSALIVVSILSSAISCQALAGGKDYHYSETTNSHCQGDNGNRGLNSKDTLSTYKKPFYRPNGLDNIAWKEKISAECTDLKGWNASNRTLRWGKFNGSNLSEAHLAATDLSDAELKGVDLGNANLSNTNLAGASFYGSSLYLANLSGAEVTGQSSFEKVFAYGADFSAIDFTPVRRHEFETDAPMFRNSDLRFTDFRGSKLCGLDFENADLRGANLSTSIFSGCPELKLHTSFLHASFDEKTQLPEFWGATEAERAEAAVRIHFMTFCRKGKCLKPKLAPPFTQDKAGADSRQPAVEDVPGGAVKNVPSEKQQQVDDTPTRAETKSAAR